MNNFEKEVNNTFEFFNFIEKLTILIPTKNSRLSRLAIF